MRKRIQNRLQNDSFLSQFDRVKDTLLAGAIRNETKLIFVCVVLSQKHSGARLEQCETNKKVHMTLVINQRFFIWLNQNRLPFVRRALLCTFPLFYRSAPVMAIDFDICQNIVERKRIEKPILNDLIVMNTHIWLCAEVAVRRVHKTAGRQEWMENLTAYAWRTLNARQRGREERKRGILTMGIVRSKLNCVRRHLEISAILYEWGRGQMSVQLAKTTLSRMYNRLLQFAPLAIGTFIYVTNVAHFTLQYAA